jgi:electron transfer flavoprotein beta subunit
MRKNMKILVPIKRVVDYNVRVRAKADGSDVDIAGVKMSINPFDEIAVEEAVRLKEKGVASEVVVVSIGVEAAQDVLRSAMAIGADRAILVVNDVEITSLDAAKILQKIVENEKPELVIIGKQAIDDDANQTGQMLAGLLGWAQGTFASKITIENGAAIVVREVDGGLATVKLKLPAVISTDLRLNNPRYAALPNIMKARSKPLVKMTVAELGVEIHPRVKHLKYEEPKKRTGGGKVKDAAELAEKIRAII